MKDVYTFADLENWSDATAGEAAPLRVAVLGDPVQHSASPPMHNAALEACDLPARYCRLHIRPDELTETFARLKAADFIGVNCTIPHKLGALLAMDEVDEQAIRIGAVNTVAFREGRLLGYNTDGPGLVRALRAEFSVDLRDLRVMILGAGGGAGRAIAVQCALEGCERLVLVNRTLEKARLLATELTPYFTSTRVLGPADRLEAVPWENAALRRQLENVDLIINATSVGLQSSDPSPLPASLLLPHLMVYDTIYTARRTSLLRAAEAAGARGANGLSMLLYQGAASFEIWFDREPPVAAMRSALLKHVRQPAA